jgi:hypothetical protein
VTVAELWEDAFRTVSVGEGSLKLLPGSGLTMLGAVRPFSVDPEDEEAGGLVGDEPTVDPELVPKLELPRGSSGSSSLQAAVKRSARANVGLGG